MAVPLLALAIMSSVLVAAACLQLRTDELTYTGRCTLAHQLLLPQPRHPLPHLHDQLPHAARSRMHQHPLPGLGLMRPGRQGHSRQSLGACVRACVRACVCVCVCVRERERGGGGRKERKREGWTRERA